MTVPLAASQADTEEKLCELAAFASVCEWRAEDWTKLCPGAPPGSITTAMWPIVGVFVGLVGSVVEPEPEPEPVSEPEDVPWS